MNRVGNFLILTVMKDLNDGKSISELVNQFEKDELSFDELKELCGGISVQETVAQPVPVI